MRHAKAMHLPAALSLGMSASMRCPDPSVCMGWALAVGVAGCGPNLALAPSPGLKDLRRNTQLEEAIQQLQVIEQVCQAVAQAYLSNPKRFEQTVLPPPESITSKVGRRLWAQMQGEPGPLQDAFRRASEVQAGPSVDCASLPQRVYKEPPPRRLEKRWGVLRMPVLSEPGELSYVQSNIIYTLNLKTGQRRVRKRVYEARVAALHAVGPYLYYETIATDETRRLYRINPGGAERPLTSGPKTQAQFLGFGPEQAYFTIDWQKAKVSELYAVPHGQEQPTRLRANDGRWDFDAMSDDGAWLAGQRVDQDPHTLALWPRYADAPVQLNLPPGTTWAYAAGFEPGSHRLWLRARHGRQRNGLYRLDLNRPSRVEAELWDPKADLSLASAAGDGRHVIALASRGAQRELRLYRTDDAAVVPWPALPGRLTEAQFAGDSSSALLTTSEGPASSILRWRIGAEAAEVLTATVSARPRDPDKSEAPGSGPRRGSVDTTVQTTVRLPDGQGGTFEAVLLRPASASQAAPVPVIIRLHGGPGGRFLAGLGALEQAWLQAGFTVFALNHRGSSGYGAKFEAADDHKHGLVDLVDVLAASRHIAALPWTQADSMAVVGGSYGGFLALRVLGAAPNLFRAGMTLYGAGSLRIEDRRSDLSARGRAWILRELGRPEARASLAADIPKIRAPLFMVYGTADQRVPRAASEALLDQLLDQGHPVAALALLGAGHGSVYHQQFERLRDSSTAFLKAQLVAAPKPRPVPRPKGPGDTPRF